MIMPREKREILKEDIMPLDVYTKNRKELRKNIVNFKKDRRIALGPYATFYFEVMRQCWLKSKRCFTLKKVVTNN
jgi:hypothetical protein